MCACARPPCRTSAKSCLMRHMVWRSSAPVSPVPPRMASRPCAPSCARRAGAPQATTLVFGDRLPARAAAQFNGTMCRALDYCDAMAPGPHIGSALFPAALAAAELAGGCSGVEFIAALAAAPSSARASTCSEGQYDGFDPTGDRGAVCRPPLPRAHPEAHARADAARARAGLQPLRRQLPEPRRRIARRALRARLGRRDRRPMRAHGSARRHRVRRIS